MTKCLSWKINDENYAYLYIPNKKNHISNRITDSVIINKMIERVNTWNEDKYRQSFSEMNEEVYTTFGVKIPYSDKYFGDIQNTNVFVLGTSKEDRDKFEEIRNELLDVIDEKVSAILKEVRETNKTTVELLNKRTMDSAKVSKETLEEAMAKLEVVKKDVEKKFAVATKTLNKAAKVLELDNLEINSDSLKNLFEVTNKTDKWVTTFSGDVETIRRNYKMYEESLPINERGKNIFKQVDEKVLKLNDDLKVINNNNEQLKEKIKIIQQVQREQNRIGQLEEKLLSAPRAVTPLRQGDFLIEATEERIILTNIKTNTFITIDNDGIKLEGDVFINGKKIQ